MFKVDLETSKNKAIIQSSETGDKAIINLASGACLENLYFNNTKIIANPTPLTYQDCYSSALMFPFCGRVEDGKYLFNNKEYQLPINDLDSHSAIHGLIYNKLFSVTDIVENEHSASVILQYISNGTTEGFPYQFSFKVIYTMECGALKINTEIQNIDKGTFPFSIGWHPYFYSEKLSESKVIFESDKRAVFNDRMLLQEFKKTENHRPLEIKEYFDDCFGLIGGSIIFETPEHTISIKTNADYVQLYTPPQNKNYIAIEPVSGSSNNFNTKIGLRNLKPQEIYTMDWSVSLIK